MLIKICGLTDSREAACLNRYGADLAGFVLFYPKSKRNNTIARAKSIMAELAPDIKRVAVVVSPTKEQIKMIEQAGFDYIQIHGELPRNLLCHISLPILRAFNVSDMKTYEKYRHCGKIAGYVFDASEPGSGTTFDWQLVEELPRDGKLFFLAGGLRPDNVSRAIRTVQPDGVDVSSGVEYNGRPGKDPGKIAEFISVVREFTSRK